MYVQKQHKHLTYLRKLKSLKISKLIKFVNVATFTSHFLYFKGGKQHDIYKFVI